MPIFEVFFDHEILALVYFAHKTIYVNYSRYKPMVTKLPIKLVTGKIMVFSAKVMKERRTPFKLNRRCTQQNAVRYNSTNGELVSVVN